MVCGLNLWGYSMEMENAVRGSLGKIISAISVQDDVLAIRFADGRVLELLDDGQNCCEHRYMHTDDDLAEVVGGVLYGIEIREVSPDADEEIDDEGSDECHDVQFLVVKTSKGEVVVSTHNEHNGYYGGFSITARVHLPWSRSDQEVN